MPLESDGIPAATTSEAVIAELAPAALAYLRRRDALDLVEVLGLGGAA